LSIGCLDSYGKALSAFSDDPLVCVCVDEQKMGHSIEWAGATGVAPAVAG
jgi:hypothetical protein